MTEGHMFLVLNLNELHAAGESDRTMIQFQICSFYFFCTNSKLYTSLYCKGKLAVNSNKDTELQTETHR